MKAHPMLFSVDSIAPSELGYGRVLCTVIRSFADKYTSQPLGERQYSFELPSKIINNISMNDKMKVILYSHGPLTTVEDYKNFIPLGRRVEIMRDGEESWELVAEEMNNEVT